MNGPNAEAEPLFVNVKRIKDDSVDEQYLVTFMPNAVGVHTVRVFNRHGAERKQIYGFVF